MTIDSLTTKVALVAFNARWTHSNLALFYIKKMLQLNGIDVTLFEFSINQSLLEVFSYFSENKFDVVAISVYIWNKTIVKDFVKDIKKIQRQVKLILGGPEVSHNSNEWLDDLPEIDYIIKGNGVFAFRDLVISNFDAKNKIINSIYHSFSETPFPYSFADSELLKDKYFYYESSRGCQFRCSYCLSSLQEQKIDAKPLDLVKNELNQIVKLKPKIVKFIDRTFNFDVIRARAIWKHLHNIDSDVKFHFEIHPQLLTKDDIKFLENIKPNHFQFEIGVQTLNNKSLTEIHRNQDWSKIRQNIVALINKTKIPIHVDLIFGLPFETSGTFQNSFNEVYQLKSNMLQLGFLKVLHGTEMKDKKDEYDLEYTSFPPYHILRNQWISFSDVLFWKNVEELLNTFYNSHQFEMTIEQMITYFETPFSLYSKMRDYWIKHNIDFHMKNWQKNALNIFDFMGSYSNDMISVIKDCLRWDWCKISNTHYYPDWLQDKESDELKKKYLSDLKKEHQVKSFKSAIFLKVHTEEIAEKVNNKSFVFVKTTSEKQIFKIVNGDLFLLNH